KVHKFILPSVQLALAICKNCSEYYAGEDGETRFYVEAADILSDGIATLNVVQGAVVVFAGDVENGCDPYFTYIEGRTYAVNSDNYVYVSTNYGYVADVDGGEIAEVYYDCDSETGEVAVTYYIIPTSAGELTVTFREAEEGELPTAIKVEYTGETDGLSDTSYGNAAYVIPGDYFSLRLEDGYTAEVTGATLYYYYTASRAAFYIDEDATAVTVNVLKIAEESTLKVVGGTDVTDAEAQEAVVKTDSTVADGDALESGVNTIRVVNGYEIEAVDGAVYYENGYVTDSDGNIYLEYVLIPTGDPAKVTITVGLVVEWVTVNFVNDTDRMASVYSYNMETVSSGVYKVLSVNTLYAYAYDGYTVKVTGGTVVLVEDGEVYDNVYYIEINEGVTEVTVEIISIDDLMAEQAELGYIDSTNDPDQQSSSSGDSGSGTDSSTGTDSGSGSDSGTGTDSGSGSGSSSSSSETAPNTGDESNVTLWAILTAALAATTGAVLTLAKKKNN
ncbi:MAG: LPXTG cell wall anchor domain-containing protein, partial [Oscillospiraceae bacterium]|nr:LPXTG cell wall anchor domain-containing protein [Oscillospiraceae bacterium]